jgi:hypothetical protein
MHDGDGLVAVEQIGDERAVDLDPVERKAALPQRSKMPAEPLLTALRQPFCKIRAATG